MMILLGKDDCKFAQTVSTVIKANHYIPFLNGSQGLIIIISKNNWINKFVGNPFVIRFLDCSKDIFTLFALSFGKQIVGQFDSVRFGDLADLQFLADDHVYAIRPLCLNLGGIAKGYAVDCAVDILLKQGVAAGCVNAGGDLRVFGHQTQKIHLRMPHQCHTLIELGVLQNGAVASSANYFYSPTSTANLGQRIIHPQQQLPSNSPHSYSVIAPQCVHADALTKVLALSQQIVHPCFERYGAIPFIFYHDANDITNATLKKIRH